MSNTKICPRCGVNEYTPYGAKANKIIKDGRTVTDPPYPALSRMDNKTYICSECGRGEAMRDFTKSSPIPPSEWPVKH